MKTMPLSEVKTKLSELVDAVERRDEVVTITRNGKPVAIIVSKDEYEGWRETVEIMKDEEFMRERFVGAYDLSSAQRSATRLTSFSPTKLFACLFRRSRSRPRFVISSGGCILS